jgi:hypothetical protein
MRQEKDSLWRRGRDGERGMALYLVVGFLFFLLASAAVVIDIGYIVHAQRELQASADAAATAGGAVLPNGTLAVSTATLYSAVPGNKNAFADLPNVTMVSGYPKYMCVTALQTQENLVCPTASGNIKNVNALQVKEQVSVPLFFGKIFGISSVTLTASATSSMRGGGPHPLNVVVIVDATGSMQNGDSNCPGTGITNPSQLDCAKSGVRTLLMQLWPCAPSQGNCGPATNGNVANPVDEVSLMVFPGFVSSTGTSYEYTNCQATNIAPYVDYNYSSTPLPEYQIVPFSSDYRTSATSGLNGSVSHFVQSVDWTDGVGCTTAHYGLQNLWETYYAGAINEAQAKLSAITGSRATMQNVIIIVSDGDAPGQGCPGGTCNGAGMGQCQAAVNAATAATRAGTWVYSIAYGSSTSPSPGSCNTDAAPMSACLAMQRIASDQSKFYSDNSGGCASAVNPSITTLNQIFQAIGNDLHTTQLIPDNLPTQ